MRAPYFIQQAGKFVQRAFDFRVPIVQELDYVDILLQDHTLLLLSWKFPRRYRLAVKGIRRITNLKQGSIIIRLPTETTSARITISSYWRKKHILLPFSKTILDPVTAATLVQQISPMKTFEVHPFNLDIFPFQVRPSVTMISLKNSFIEIRIPNLAINREQINTTFHEQRLL